MRLSKVLIVVPILALLAMGCAPRRPCPYGGPHGGKAGMGMMMHGCGPDSCFYRSRCFSSGAVQSNDGVCQACSGGKWVEASGCSDHHHGCCGHPGCPGPKDCPMMKGGKAAPCGDHPCGAGGCGHGPHGGH